MIKKILLLLSISILAFGADAKWQTNIPRGNDKPVVVMVEKQGCPWCKKMKENTFTNGKVLENLKDFHLVLIGIQRWNRMGFEQVTSVPTIFFLDNEKRVVKKAVGYWEAGDFLVDIKAAKDALK